jgi:hypothetical protein
MMQRVQNCELYTEIVCKEKLQNLIVFSSNGTLEKFCFKCISTYLFKV